LGLYIAGARNNFILWGRRCVRDRGFENQRYRASGLNLVVAAIVLWNTAYLDETYIRVKGRWCYLYRAIDSLPLAAMLGSYPAHRRFSSPLETPTADCPNWIERKIGCLPVVETGRVVGILTEAVAHAFVSGIGCFGSCSRGGGRNGATA
jgi:hypothetical protein